MPDFEINSENISDLLGMTEKLTDNYKKANEEQTKFYDTLKNSQNINIGMLTELPNLIGKLTDNVAKAIKNNGDIHSLGTALISIGVAGSGIATASNYLKDLGSTGKAAASATLQISEKMEALKAHIEKLPAGKLLAPVVNVVAQYTKAAESARNLGNALIISAAASGDFSSMMSAMNNDVNNINDRISQFNEFASRMGTELGIGEEAAGSYAFQLKAIPGIINQTINAGTKLGGNMHMLEAVLKVARGSGRDFADVIDDMKNLYKNTGMEAEHMVGVIAKMQTTTDSLRLPFEYAHNVINKTVESFKFLGGQAGDSLDILSKFAPALRNFGLGPAAIQDIVTTYTDSISKLDIAQRAFLSAQTGGPGGFKGAFQIEYALREGNIEQVQQQIQDALMTQFGGRVVSLEEAARSESAAAERVKQMQILTSGPLKMVDSLDKASALLEAMAGEAAPGEGIDTALTDILQRGNTLVESQKDISVGILNSIQETFNQFSNIADDLRKGIFGIDSSIKIFSDMVQHSTFAGQAVAGYKLTAGKTIKEGANISPEEAVHRAVTNIDQTLLGIPSAIGNKLEKEISNIFPSKKTPPTPTEDITQPQMMQRPLVPQQIQMALNTPQYAGALPPTPTLANTLTPLQLQQMLSTMKPTTTEKEHVSHSLNVDITCAKCQEKQLKAIIDDQGINITKQINASYSPTLGSTP